MKLSIHDLASYGIALLFALLVHGVVIGLMAVNWEDSTFAHTEIKPYYIEATVVAENPYTAAAEKKRNREQQRVQDRLNNRRALEQKLQQEQADWEKQRAERKREPVPAPLPVVEPEPVEPEVVDNERDEAQVRTAFEEAIALALAQEENARKAVTDDEKAMAYVAQMQREIVQNWSRPPSARNGMLCLLRVRLIPTGEVIDVKVEESSGNDAFDRSAILAVKKAGRFIVPSDTRLFERDFREFTVRFRPDDLRL